MPNIETGLLMDAAWNRVRGVTADDAWAADRTPNARSATISPPSRIATE
jgi:hypothetical protein